MLLFICVYMYVYGHRCARAWVWRSGENLWTWFSPFTMWIPAMNLKLSGLVVSTFTHYAILLVPKFYLLLLLLLLLYLYMSNVWMLAHPCKTVFKSLSSFCLRFVRQNSGSNAYIPSTFTQQTLLTDHRAFSFLMTVVKVLAIMSDDLSLISEPLW